MIDLITNYLPMQATIWQDKYATFWSARSLQRPFSSDIPWANLCRTFSLKSLKRLAEFALYFPWNTNPFKKISIYFIIKLSKVRRSALRKLALIWFTLFRYENFYDCCRNDVFIINKVTRNLYNLCSTNV